jgi:hypothetical protein
MLAKSHLFIRAECFDSPSREANPYFLGKTALKGGCEEFSSFSELRHRLFSPGILCRKIPLFVDFFCILDPR